MKRRKPKPLSNVLTSKCRTIGSQITFEAKNSTMSHLVKNPEMRIYDA